MKILTWTLYCLAGIAWIDIYINYLEFRSFSEYVKLAIWSSIVGIFLYVLDYRVQVDLGARKYGEGAFGKIARKVYPNAVVLQYIFNFYFLMVLFYWANLRFLDG